MARYEAKLDLSKEFEKSFSLPLFTGDSGSDVSLEFYQDGVPYDMSGAMLYARRADGVILASSGIAKGNKAELMLTNNMYVCPGELQVQISVVDAYGNFLTSGILYFTVREGFSEQAQGEGSDDYCDLTALIRKVGEGLGSIQRAETAVTMLDTLMKKIPNLENQIIEHITEEETNRFVSGFAIVSAIESVDSEGGPIATEYHYPLMAESEDLFGNVTVLQTRFFKGNWEQRVVGEEWNSLSVDLSDYVTESDLNRKLSSVYKYKGSVETVNDLPSVNEIGDVWNVKHGNVGDESLRLIPFTSIEVDVAGAYVGYYDGTKYPVISSEEEWLNVDLYDENYNLILSSQSVTIKPEYVFSPPFDSRFLTAKYFQLTEGSNIGEVISPGLQVEAGDNVAWTGSEWDVLAGTTDMSCYVTKEELGNIEAALSRIESLQNAYINGSEV